MKYQNGALFLIYGRVRQMTMILINNPIITIHAAGNNVPAESWYGMVEMRWNSLPRSPN